MNNGPFVPRRSRRNRHAEYLSFLTWQFLNRRPFTVLKDENRRPIQFWDRIFVAIGINKPACGVPSAVVRPNPVRACTYDDGPNTASRFLGVTLREFIRKYGKRHPPQFTVVMRRQFRLEGFKQYRVVFDDFHEPILQYA